MTGGYGWVWEGEGDVLARGRRKRIGGDLIRIFIKTQFARLLGRDEDSICIAISYIGEANNEKPVVEFMNMDDDLRTLV